MLCDVKTETTELRCAVRFPLRLPVAFHENGKLKRNGAWTQNISAGGVLIHCPDEYPAGSMITFSIIMPANMLAAEQDVQVECVGRVVRCTPLDVGMAVAAIIDEYRISR